MAQVFNYKGDKYTDFRTYYANKDVYEGDYNDLVSRLEDDDIISSTTTTCYYLDGEYIGSSDDKDTIDILQVVIDNYGDELIEIEDDD